MSGFPGSPRVVKGAFLIHTGLLQAPVKVAFQYNPATLQRALLPQSVPQTGKNQDPYRVGGQPAETITLEVEFDATDQLESPDQNPVAVQSGVYPQLAALESIMRPVPMTSDSPYVEFVWGNTLVVPVLITSCTVTEEAFDTNLNPIRAKANLVMKVLTSDDLPLNHPGSKVYEDYLKALEGLAKLGAT